MSDGSPFQQASSAANDYTKLLFVFQQLMRGVATATLVRVVACSSHGELDVAGTVDVVPMVHQVDGQGQPVPHGTVYGMLYLRIQGGNTAIIIDPKPGDIGVAVFASRDISAVKASKSASNPASARVFDYADGIYLGGVLNGQPTQLIQCSDAGIVIHSPTKVQITSGEIDLVSPGVINISAGESVNITSPAITLEGDVTVNGSMASTADMTANGVSVHNHVHGNVTHGPNSTDPPT